MAMPDAGGTRAHGSAPGGIPVTDDLWVVLVGTTHPGNIGAAARAMKTMGLSRLILVAPKQFPSAEATARASGADDLLAGAVVAGTLAEAVAPCAWVVGTSARARHIQWPEVDARTFAAEATRRARSGPVAVVFGRENSGLSNAELDRCHALLRLPSAPDFSSLNLAAAVQVVSYELCMAQEAFAGGPPGDDGPVAHDAVTQADMDGFFDHLEQALIDVGYFDPGAPRLLRRRLRRMFNRMSPDRSELNILRGILTAAQRHSRKE